MTLDLVSIGHVSRDEFPSEETWRLGGTALYAAATAARLGARVALVTRVGPNEREALERRCAELGIELHPLASGVTTTFAFSFDARGRRSLRLRARAKGIARADLPEELLDARSAVLASIAHELAPDLFELPIPVRVLVAQGELREWAADGLIRARDWDGAAAALDRVTAAVLSEEDLPEPSLIERWAPHAPVVVTLAERGARLHADDETVEIPGFRAARVVDPTGAGDAFAAALALALADGDRLPDAVRFANAAASFAVEDIGTAGLADRAGVAARLQR